MLLSYGWLLALTLLGLGYLLILPFQYREPGLRMPPRQPLPVWTRTLISLLASGAAGLGFGLLVTPGFWGGLVPWAATDLDARALRVWSLTLGAALLIAQMEDDPDRVAAGLPGVALTGIVGLAAFGWHGDDVDGSGWAVICFLVLVGGLAATGLIGMVLRRTVKPV